MSIEIVDAQLHEVGPRLSWDGPVEFRHRLMTEVTVAWMDAAGVDAALINPHDRVWADFAVRTFPHRLRSVWLTGYPSPEDGERMVADVLAVRARSDVLGLRIVAGRRLDDPDGVAGRGQLENRLLEPLFDACEHYEVPLFIFASGNLDLVARALELHPQLKVIIDLNQPGGLFAPSWSQAALTQDRSDLRALAAYPVAVKVCGLPAVAKSPFPYRDTLPFLHGLIELFGADRIIWASDATRYNNRTGWQDSTKHASSASIVGNHAYADSFRFIRDTTELGDIEKAQILGGNLRKFLGWTRDTAEIAEAVPGGS
jgi:L-fuconolactonase